MPTIDLSGNFNRLFSRIVDDLTGGLVVFNEGTIIPQGSLESTVLTGTDFGEGIVTPVVGTISDISLTEIQTNDGTSFTGEALHFSDLDIDVSSLYELGVTGAVGHPGFAVLTPEKVIEALSDEDFTINGSDQADIIRRGGALDFSGNDTFNLGGGNDVAFTGAGDDIVRAGSGRDTIRGGGGDDQLFGNSGNDALRGGVGDDILNGQRGRDDLSGGRGNDMLDGGVARDTLDGGRGNDILTGGNGSDEFIFSDGYGQDTITDFELGADKIVLDDDLWEGDLTAQEVVDMFGTVRDGQLVLDFGDNELILENLDSTADLADDLIIV